MLLEGAAYAADPSIQTAVAAAPAQGSSNPVALGDGGDRAMQPAAAQSEATAKDGQGVSSEKIAALVGGGVAIAGFAFSTAFALVANSEKSDAQRVCPGSTQCATQEGVDKWHRADVAANGSTLAFVIGCAGALEAAVFWLLPDSKRTRVGVGPGVIRIRGTW
jgi:hypothetical protein